MADDLTLINQRAAESHIKNAAAEAEAKEQAATLQVDADRLGVDLVLFGDITLVRYVLESIKSGVGVGGTRARLVAIFAPIVLALGLVGQSLATAGTLTTFAGEAISKAMSRTESTEVSQVADNVSSGEKFEQPTGQSAALVTATREATTTRTATATTTPTRRPTSTRSFTATAVVVADARSKETETGTVVRVIDGDTIDVEIEGTDYRVRYIGIDTPESSEVCGTDAAQINVTLVFGKTVTLEKDVSETDRFDRLLRYVYVGDDMVNAELVRLGFAESVRFPPDTKYAGDFDSLQVAAKASNLGCWPSGAFGGTGGGGEGYTPTSVPLPTNTPVPTIAASPIPPLTSTPAPLPTATAAPVPAEQSSCHPSYQGACLLIGAGDYDCAGGSGNGPNYTGRVTVVGFDEFRLDGDGDGVGCE